MVIPTEIGRRSATILPVAFGKRSHAISTIGT
jgi:hypothetical protein